MNANDPAELLEALHRTAHARMIADVPTVKERMEFMQAWRDAGEWLRDNAALSDSSEERMVENIQETQ